jgi:hypothetical protein
MPCPKCGAPFDSEAACRDQFNLGQFLELEQPENYAVHYLSVPCYMLQHNIYSRDGWLEVRELLRRFVEEGLTPEEVRRRYRHELDSGNRTISFTRGPKLEAVAAIHWSFTVERIRLDSPEHYCADVWEWARSILADSAPLVG